MRKRLILASVVAVLAACPAHAAALAHTPAFQSAEFDKLVADSRKSMMADPKFGLDAARRAVAIAQGRPASASQREALATGLWLEAEGLMRTNRLPEARAALDRAAGLASKDGQTSSLGGELALSLARAAHIQGDIALSLKSYLKAYGIFLKIGRPRGQSLALQGLGVIYEQARDVPREIAYYSKAAEVYSAEPTFQISIANNIGFALREAGRYDESLAQFRKALEIARSLKGPVLEARILTNIAAVEAKRKDFKAAGRAADLALKLLGRNDTSGWAPLAWGIKSEIDFDRGALLAAHAEMDEAFRNVDLKTTIQPYRDIHEVAYKLYGALGDYPLALAHLEAFKRLDDEGRELASSANLALMNARFDFANQNLEIEHLKRVQLEREASLRETRTANQKLTFLTFISIALVLLVYLARRHVLLRKHQVEISKANVELKKSVGERDREIARRVETESHLRDAIGAAEQANRAKTRFLANMSHELRTPLNAIIGFSEMIASGALPAGKAAEYSADINASGRKLLGILADILDTARLDAGAVSLNEGEVVLAECVEQAVVKAAGQVDTSAKHITITGDRALKLRGDARRLVQVVEKLVVNAAKFTARDGRIEIRCQRAKGGGIDMVVADDGVGIAPGQIDHIMDRFGQVENPYARTHGGIGLGLPIVKSLVMLHGGTLTIRSQPHQGTMVCIHLPAERDLGAAAGTATAAA